jgi:type II secretory pathway component GspD/PulD (secretin)
MKNLLNMGAILSFLALSSGTPVFAENEAEEFYKQWIDYRNGEISVAFEQTPVQFALHALQVRTGIQIVMPSATEAKFVSLRLERQPLEPAIRSLISTIGYRNFALMYDENGRPQRAVVLAVPPVATVNPIENAEVAAVPVTLEERDQLKKDLERWNELKEEERSRVEERLKNLPSSDDREILVKDYGRQLLRIAK